MTATRFRLPRITDPHCHYRQYPMLPGVCATTRAYLGRTLAMPNTDPPIVTAEEATQYHSLLRQYLAPGVDVMIAVKMTRAQTPMRLRQAADLDFVPVVKLYPEGATTGSGDGISADILREPEKHTWFCDCIETMQARSMIFALHGEMPYQEDPLLSEPDFIPFVKWLLTTFPRLRIIMEHITTVESVEFIKKADNHRLAGSITLHHLFTHIGHLVGRVGDRYFKKTSKLNPFLFCWPMPKRPPDMHALRRAAFSGLECYFLGSDNAPHLEEDKRNCGCAGVMTSPCLVEALMTLFEEHDALDRLPNFVTHYADAFYRRSLVEGHVNMLREPFTVPDREAGIQPFLSGVRLPWRIE